MYTWITLQTHIPNKLGNDIISLVWRLQSLEQQENREGMEWGWTGSPCLLPMSGCFMSI